MSQSIVLNWPELHSVLEPLIQQIVQQELKKLVSTPVVSQEKMTQTQWQEFIRETSGSWPEMPMAEELREGWDNFTQREFQRYLLDTNTVIYHFKGLGQVSTHLAEVGFQELLLPTLVIFELQVGVAKAGFPEKRMIQLDKFINATNEVSFGKREAHYAALVRAKLEKMGTPIGCIDVLIAGTALANHATLVTHNINEFSRVEGLKVVDWY